MTIQDRGTSFASTSGIDLRYMQLVDYRSRRVADSVVVNAIPGKFYPENQRKILSKQLFDKLTPSERLVVQGVADGLSDKEIGRRLSKESATVRVQLRSIFGKLKLQNRIQIAIAAITYGGYTTQMQFPAKQPHRA